MPFKSFIAIYFADKLLRRVVIHYDLEPIETYDEDIPDFKPMVLHNCSPSSVKDLLTRMLVASVRRLDQPEEDGTSVDLARIENDQEYIVKFVQRP